MSSEKVALIGLGRMGSAIGKRLIDGKVDLTVYNRTAAKMNPFKDLGAKICNNPKDAVKDADVVITSLLDDNAVMTMLAGDSGIIKHLKPGAIHLGTSTILPNTSKILSDLHEKNNSIYIGANVLGIPKVAMRGELTSIVAGPLDKIEKCTPILKSYSAKILNAGTQAYQANVLKIVANYLLITAIEAFGQLYTFAEKSGVDLDIVHDFFHSVFAHPSYKLYIDKIKEQNFDEANFALSGGFKDLHLFQQAFADVRVAPGFANLIADKFIIAMAQGMENKDWCAISKITRKQAGLS